MAAYRAHHIQPNTIAMMPIQGYVNSTNYSPDSIRWLDFIAETEGLNIQHALNSIGEYRVDGISVDGFCKETNTIYQFQVNPCSKKIYYFIFRTIVCVFFN